MFVESNYKVIHVWTSFSFHWCFTLGNDPTKWGTFGEKWQKISRYSRINLKKYLRLLLDDDIHNSDIWSTCHQNTEKIATAMVGLKWMLRWMITQMQTNSFSSQKIVSPEMQFVFCPKWGLLSKLSCIME